MPYQYVRSTNNYRDTATGRYVSKKTILAYREKIVVAGGGAGDSLGGQVASGAITPQAFRAALRQEVKDSYLQNYILGRGGRGEMTQADYGRIGAMIKPQYALIDGFVDDIENDLLSEAQIRARARQYFQGTTLAYERGNAEAWGMPELPAYPADGSSECNGGDKCNWRFENRAGGVVAAYWILDGGEHCPTCLDRGDNWNPLLVTNGVLGDYKDIHAHIHHEGEHHADRFNDDSNDAVVYGTSWAARFPFAEP